MNVRLKGFQISIVNDEDYEGNETVVVTLGAPTNAELGATYVHTLTIIDDEPGVRFSSSYSFVDEDGGTTNIEVVLTTTSD